MAAEAPKKTERKTRSASVDDITAVANPEMDSLRKRRKALQQLILATQSRVHEFGAGTLNPTENALSLELQDLERHNSNLAQLYEATAVAATTVGEMCLEGEDFKVYFRTVKNLQLQVLEFQSILRKKREAAERDSRASSAKLKALEAPTFSGKFEDWQAFHDQFQAIINSRRGLPGSEKLSYLQIGLKAGSAADVVSSFAATNDNFNEAWDLLQARYNVSREIIFAHINAFEDFKPTSLENDNGLRSISNALNKLIRSLKGRSVAVEHWDLILIYLTLKKMDMGSKRQWALDLKADIPTMKDFLEFLEKRARALTTASNQKKEPSQSTGPGKTPKQVFHTTHELDNVQQ
jgi:hypothetical protein